MRQSPSSTEQFAIEVVDLRRLQVLAEIHPGRTRYCHRRPRTVANHSDLCQGPDDPVSQQQISVEVSRALPKQIGIADIQNRSEHIATLSPFPPKHHVAASVTLGEHDVVDSSRGVVAMNGLLSPGKQSINLVGG